MGRQSDSDSLFYDRRRSAVALFAAMLAECILAVAVVLGLGSHEGGVAHPPAPLPAAYDIALDPPAPTPTPTPTATRPRAEGAQGAAGRKARATQIVAMPPRIVVPAAPAAPAASTGSDTRSGASAAGAGTGGGTGGGGTGAGGAGNGNGGRALAQRAVKIAGDITSTRDYPPAGREQRLGRHVIVALDVGTDGRVAACHVHQPSGDPEADAITCRLAVQRFRFRPALDQAGMPIESIFGWEQRWFAP